MDMDRVIYSSSLNLYVGQWDNFQWHNYYIRLVLYSLEHGHRPT